MEKVEEQYKNWVYPLPVEDMEEAIKSGAYWEVGDPTLYWPLFRPQKRSVDNLNILIAGCGTNQAAYYACKNRSWNVVGIDLSDSSLAHQNLLKEKHKLDNLRLAKMNILNVSNLGETFDFITSTGVIHHMEDPLLGLRALNSVLKDDGAINLMVYGKSLRLGVYLLQDVFKKLNFSQDKRDTDLVRKVIETLPIDHVARKYIEFGKKYDLYYDSGIVDTFLHPQDTAYYVDELFKLTRSAGLEFLSWCDPVLYNPKHFIPAAHPLWQKLEGLDPETAAHVCDLLVQRQGTHRWFSAKPDYAKKIRIRFDTDDFLKYCVILHRNTKILKPANHQTRMAANCERDEIKFDVGCLLAELLKISAGKETIIDTLKKIYKGASLDNDVVIELKKEIRSLWELGHLYILLPEDKS